ncbi:alpha/beta hydrolase [Thermosipho atlanticus]|uniref:Esterase/lipase n=1 Tax=Thermosipho atlanticus DSM 15807 TaxID=1123380 RepID=A0A1M5U0E6_9BACT|nr:alpha/beta fold hydrolase [Thermosipho atlanticus]SHH56414.1 Esterase/lipase [Thermosipho atlanticus DSM 15807]
MKYVVSYQTDPKVIEESSRKIILKSNYPTIYKESSVIHLYYYSGKPKTDKTLLFIHGLGTGNIKYLKWFPEKFSQYGYDSYLMILPYHFERTPKGYKSGELFLKPESLRERFEHAIVDALTSLEYIRNKHNSKSYLMGFSFGGMISTIASAFYKVDGLSLCVTGGNFYHITWKSFATKVLRMKYEENKECDVEKCRNFHGESFYKFIDDIRSPNISKDSAPISCYEYDPVVFAKFVKSPTIMFRAIFDIFIPKSSSLELFERIGSNRKKMYTIFSGHLTSYIFKNYIFKKTVEFFEKNTVV